MKMSELSPAPGSTKSSWRVGRGPGSGNGKTSGRGHKGQKSRSGYSRRMGFEGGQMPLHRRLPKRGFVNIFAKPLTCVNLSDFDAFEAGATVNIVDLFREGIVNKCPYGLKVLGGGELKNAITIQADAFSTAAAQKIEAKGGKAEVI